MNVFLGMLSAKIIQTVLMLQVLSFVYVKLDTIRRHPECVKVSMLIDSNLYNIRHSISKRTLVMVYVLYAILLISRGNLLLECL